MDILTTFHKPCQQIIECFFISYWYRSCFSYIQKKKWKYMQVGKGI